MKEVKDFSVSRGEKAGGLVGKFAAAGFQATELGRAVEVLKRMRADKDCLKFLAFTANMVASGLRGCIAQLVAEGFADVIITTGGSIDHDVIKSFAPYEVATFGEDDAKLHSRGINRIGNILVPNDRYVLLEKKLQPVFKRLYARKKTVSANELINAVADSLPKNEKNSFLVQAAKRNAFVYSPALIDSALGLQLYFFKQEHRDFALDEAADLPAIATRVLSAKRTGALVLGGGSSKHFTLGANLLRGGLDYSVYVSTAAEFDGSLSGAPPKEAKSWGKIRAKANTALVNCDATIALPLMMSALE